MSESARFDLSRDFNVTIVEAPTTGAPRVAILQPSPNQSFSPHELVVLTGIGNDPDDDPTLTYEWAIKGSGLV